jgi:hypothetical protein
MALIAIAGMVRLADLDQPQFLPHTRTGNIYRATVVFFIRLVA